MSERGPRPGDRRPALPWRRIFGVHRPSRWWAPALLATGYALAALLVVWPSPAAGSGAGSGVRVQGAVTAGGRGLEGAEVQVWAPVAMAGLPARNPARDPAEPVAVAATGEDGTFTLTLPGPGSWVVRIRAPGRVGRETLVEARRETLRLEAVELPRARELAVRVLGRGEGLEDAEIAWPADEAPASVPAERWRPIPSVVRTDGEGVASLRIGADPNGGDPNGGPESVLRVTARGFEPARVPLAELLAELFADPGPDGGPVEISLVPRRRGVGWVVDGRDRPVEGAEVRLVGAGDSGESPSELGPFRTGADGGFEVPDPPAGRYDLEVDADGFGLLTVPGIEVPPGAGTIDLGVVGLTAGVELAGRVVDGAGRPVAAARVLLRPAGSEPWEVARALGEAPEEVTTDAGGAFVFTGLVDGARVRLRVEKEGAAPRESPSLTLPVREPVEIVLPATAALSGWVVDGAGGAVPGALVTARPGSGSGEGFGRRPADRGKSTRTSEHGEFEIRGLRSGPVTLTVSAPGYQDRRLAGLELEAGDERTGVEIALDEGVELGGRVVRGDGLPATGATVELVNARGGSEAYARVDEAGRFRWRGLSPGPHSVVARGANGARTTRTVDVGAVRDVLLELDGGVGVSGWVVRADGSPVAGARVVLASAEPAGGGLEARSDSLGRFEWPDVTEGRYHLFASAEGLAPSRGVTVEVSGSPVTGLEVELRDGITVRGQVLGVELADLSSVVVRRLGTPGGGVARVDHQGRFVLRHLPPGRVVLRAEVDGAGRCVLERLDLPRGAREVEVLLSLDGASAGC